MEDPRSFYTLGPAASDAVSGVPGGPSAARSCRPPPCKRRSARRVGGATVRRSRGPRRSKKWRTTASAIKMLSNHDLLVRRHRHEAARELSAARAGRQTATRAYRHEHQCEAPWRRRSAVVAARVACLGHSTGPQHVVLIRTFQRPRAAAYQTRRVATAAAATAATVTARAAAT